VCDSARCFFFFKAEDGIRDWSVTGVQTCALPIFIPSGLAREILTGLERCEAHVDIEENLPRQAARDETLTKFALGIVFGIEEIRSEERRVGKESRSRWSAEH